jgi:hypothetical protein
MEIPGKAQSGGLCGETDQDPQAAHRRQVPWNIQFAVWGTPAVFVAHQLKLFSLLAEKPRSLDEICKAKKLKRRPAEAILSVTTSLGITRLRSDRYSFTHAGEDYFIETSPTYYGAALDFTIDNYPVWSIESLRQSVMTDSPKAYGGVEMFKSHEEQDELARKFTRTMHSASMAPASGWPGKVNLAKHRVMLDVAGGSGAHFNWRSRSMAEAERGRLRYCGRRSGLGDRRE